MDLSNWKTTPAEPTEQRSWEYVYYHETDREERRHLLEERVSQEEQTEEIELLVELYEHRYTPRKDEPAKIDHMIKGLVDIKFLDREVKGIFGASRDQAVARILECLGYDIISKHGEIGARIWYNELCNAARVYIKLCHTDRHYSGIIFGFGKMKKGSLDNKIAWDIIDLAFRVPAATGTTEYFSEVSRALTETFCEEVPEMKDDFVENAVKMKKETKPIKGLSKGK